MRTSHSYFLLLLSVCLLMLTACDREEESDDLDLTGVYPYQNPPYPVNADTLRILVLGNSFTGNSLRYLNAMIDSASINNRRLCIYNKTIDGSGIDVWLDSCKTNGVTDIVRVAGGLKMESHGEILSLINQMWDVIVFTQASSLSYKWSSFANLPEYMKMLSENCQNPNVCLVYNIPWSHTPKDMPWMLEGNYECCNKMTAQCGITQFIPDGTAVQIARSTRLNDDLYMTSDKWHLNEGIGQYVACCTWFQKLIFPVFKTNIVGNKARPKGDYSDDDIRLAQVCAQKALFFPFNYNIVVE